ncbi:E3 ubiquitin-protein ligase TRIM9 [Nematostella vectensis]|uniref:E3 ubiquitin-protein ligase TRIM9 n=1 Tax=Nematostella vectensis TaxID=45351 RepID=UPI0020772E4F|nr:E3 ubiquitin-protein ligase TRIM9 [Nematostella vectensis]
MEGELTCPICLELFQRPVVLPCSHNLCTRCARRILEPRGSSKAWADWVTENKGPNYKSHLEPDVKCPSCRRKIPVDPRGVDALPRNLILENVIERFKEERAVPGRQAQQPVLCQFCEDVAPQTATCTCKQCGFSYCGTCFDACHPMKGPLASHTLGPPDDKVPKPKNTSNMMCPDHPHERMALYCYGCRSAVCYLCKEAGSHRAHHVELLEKVFRKTKDEVTRSLGTLMRRNTATQKLVDTLEGMCAVAKKSGNDVESHVKKECDALLAIVEKKKAELLDNVNSEYNEKLAELHETILECDKTLQQSLGLVEFSQEALKEDNPVTFLQTSSALQTRMALMLESIKGLRPASSITPTFEHMAVDTSWERKILKKLTWLQIPDCPSFAPSQCRVTNRTVYLVWSQPHSAVDSYQLEAEVTNPSPYPGGGDNRELIQVCTGTSCRYIVECAQYSARVVARVKAANRAGEGPFSKEIVLRAAKGLHFKLDPSSCTQRELVFSRDLLVAKVTSAVPATLLGDVMLGTGRHYWKVKVDQFAGCNHAGYLAVGVAAKPSQEKVIGDYDDSFGLQIFENTTKWCDTGSQFIQVKQKTKEFKGCNIAVLLDLDEQMMNVYLNGKLQTPDTRPGGPSFVGVSGTFSPALSVYGTSAQMTLIPGLQSPSTPPGIPVINLEDCSIDNTKISFAWVPPEQCNVDCYIMEVDILDREGDIHQERTFTKVYQGPRNKFTLRGLEYNVTVVARVKAVNTAGEGEPSEEISLSTEKGVIFKLDTETIHKSLKLSNGDMVVSQSSSIHSNVFGDALLADGCHYWRVNLDFCKDNAFIAVGVARRPTQDSIIGNDTNSFALQVFQGAAVRTENTKNKIQIKRKAKDLKNSAFGVLLDLNKEILNVYLDGELQTDSGRPKGPSFKGLSGMFCAGLCLYGAKVQLNLVTGIETPPPPDPPSFNQLKCKVENTTVHFGWHPPASRCPVDYYILEIDMVKAAEFGHRKRKDRKFKRVYEGPKLEHYMLSVPYSVKLITRIMGINMAGEGTPCDELVLSTPKGLYFQLDPSTANHELEMSPDNCTVALKSPMYTFILGNVKLSSGRHYWRVHVDEFSSPNQLSIIGVGVARGIIDDPILGEDSHSYAVQINEHPTTTCINTKNRIQIKRSSAEMTNSNVGVLLNLDDHLLNIYFNGKLVTDNSRPNGPTFHGITQAFYPALSLYGMNVKLTVHTGEAFDT